MREPSDRLDGEGEHPQPALPGERRVQHAETAGGCVPRIRKERLSLGFTLLVDPLEPGVGQVDLAPNLHHLGPAAALQRERHVGDGAEVGGDVLADLAVAPRGAHREPAVLVGQAHRGAVDFDLGGVAGLADLGHQAGVALLPGGQLVGGEGVGEREHGAPVGVLGQRTGHRRADPLRRAVGRLDLGMLRLQALQVAEEAVVLGVADFGRVEHVVRVVGAFDLLPKRGRPLGRPGCHREAASWLRTACATPESRPISGEASLSRSGSSSLAARGG